MCAPATFYVQFHVPFTVFVRLLFALAIACMIALIVCHSFYRDHNTRQTKGSTLSYPRRTERTPPICIESIMALPFFRISVDLGWQWVEQIEHTQ